MRDAAWDFTIFIREIGITLLECASERKRLTGPANTKAADTAAAVIVSVVGTRWSIEDFFKQAKGQVGLDHYEVRSWLGWHRHMTLALWALALLTIATAQAKGGSWCRSTRAAQRPRTAPPAEQARRRTATGAGNRVVALAPPASGNRQPLLDPPLTAGQRS